MKFSYAALRFAITITVLALASLGAVAGQDCAERPPATSQALDQGMLLGKKVRDQLEESGATAALVGRVGLNLSEYGQRYSHMGVAFRDHVLNRWQVVHLFNTCGQGDSDILTQPLESFFQTELYAYDALVLVPGYAKQVKLRKTFMSPASSRKLHQKAYNLISHPFSTQYQNSNQWILETMALSFSNDAIADRADAQRWLKAQDYEPGTVRIPNLRRSAARLFSPHVHFSDHTQEELEKQTYLVVTVDSIVQFLLREDPQSSQQTVR